MKGTVTIGSENFELCGNVESSPLWENKVEMTEIYDVYVKPSKAKVNIWLYWCGWAMDIISNGGKVNMMISGHQSQTFSIVAKVALRNGRKYKVYITRDHDRAWCIG